MENNLNLSPEELEKMLEKAKKEAQAMLDKMTPEERERAEIEAKKLVEEDKASMQKLIDDAAKIAAESSHKAKEMPKFCMNCGAPVSGGKFCTHCGSPLQSSRD